ncbi:hypothetical protein GE09DRAFT_1079192 [Coniochaeta sp. 2T2.1]|nr:hypothetical protein GE09DRAFT_1079192 [Coniochaeta sp. 2T2.1]
MARSSPAALAKEIPPVALKIFHRNKQPWPDEHWSFEKECRNLAIIEKLQWAIKKSESAPNQRICLEENPQSRSDARRNLKAFSDEARLSSSTELPKSSVPSPPVPRITGCYGWTKIEQRKIPGVHPPVGPPPGAAIDTESGWSWALVFELVPGEKQDIAVGQSHLEFFYWTGFAMEPYRLENWRGGRLVDFSDLSTCLEFPGLWWNKHGWLRRDAEKWFTSLEWSWGRRTKYILFRPATEVGVGHESHA